MSKKNEDSDSGPCRVSRDEPPVLSQKLVGVPTSIEGLTYCPGCKHYVDESVCHCGSGPEDSEHGGYVDFYTHSFVPMGCQCGYMDFADVVKNLNELEAAHKDGAP
jgi:hypothetical protein